jgi:putative ABC transport system permease protein
VAIGIATAVAVFILDHNTLITLINRELQRYGAPDLEVTPAVQDTAAFRASLEALAGRPFIRNATPVFFTTRLVSHAGGALPLEVIGVEPDAGGWYGGYYLHPGGEDVTVASEAVILLTDTAAKRLGAGIGDSIRFTDRPDLPFRVIGLTTTWKLGMRNNGHVGFVPFWSGWRAFGVRTVFPRCWVKTDGSMTFEALRADLGPSYQTVLPDYLTMGETGDKKVMRDGVRVSGLLTLFLGLYLVFTALSMALAERIREIGLMQALGTTDRQITAVFLLEAGMMALIGAVLGLIAGAGLAWGLMKLGFSSLGTGTQVWFFAFPRRRVLLILLLGIGSAMLGVLYPLLKSRRIPVVEALKQRGLRLEVVLSRRLYGRAIALFAVLTPLGYAAAGHLLHAAWQPAFPLVLAGVAVFALLFGIIFLGPSFIGWLVRRAIWPVSRLFLCEGLLVERTLSRATDRIAASLCTLAVVFAGVIGLKHMTMSLKMQGQAWADETLRQVVFVSTRLLTPEEYGRLARIAGVRSVIPMSHTVAAPFLIRGIPAGLFDYGPLRQNAALYNRFAATPSLLLSRQLAYALRVSAGDSLLVQTPGGPVRLPIAAVTDAYGYFIDERAYGVMTLEHMAALFGVEAAAAGQFSLMLTEAADPEAIRNTLYSAFGEYPMEVVTGAQKRDWVIGGVDEDFSIFEILLTITAMLAGIGVANALLIGALERRREFGLLQALGVTPAQLGRIVVLEGAVIGLVGGLLGGGLGIPLSWLIIEGLRLISELPLAFHLSPAWIGLGAGAAVFVSTAAGVYPAWRTLRMPVTESIQYE